MSIIFGFREPEGRLACEAQLGQLAAPTERYAPDGTFVRVAGRLAMGFQPYHTHDRSRLECLPAADASGNLLSIDGRFDNHCDLIRELDMDGAGTSDSRIAMKAFYRWGEDCFSRFIGDWAIALWDQESASLYLARDHAGTRTLYFQERHGVVLWSTYLDTFFAANASQPLNKEYLSCFLALLPLRDRTPFAGIRAIPPSHYLVFDGHGVRTRAHWNWFARTEIRYDADGEYERHFLHLFGESVKRRTDSGGNAIAQLSGGMDSTSIVCMSDHLRKGHETSQPTRLDTLSYYDDSEPSWDERTYFSITEAQRRKIGVHIDTSTVQGKLDLPETSHGIYRFPGADNWTVNFEKRVEESIGDLEYRVVLSGVGGDEVLGGVPTPFPELAEYLLRGKLTMLGKQTLAWSLARRVPYIHLLTQTCGFALSLYSPRFSSSLDLPPWMTEQVRAVCRDLAHENNLYARRALVSPNALINGLTWWSIMETLPNLTPGILKRYEYRYPYLDRDLVDFLYRVPRDQIVRPGFRRSLMRRALLGIVPAQILDRRRKAFISRGQVTSLTESAEQLRTLFANSLAGDLGLIDPHRLLPEIEAVLGTSSCSRWPQLAQTIRLEIWLRSNKEHCNVIESLPQVLGPITGNRSGRTSSGQVESYAD